MDTALVRSRPKISVRSASTKRRRPSPYEVELAVQTRIAWAGDYADRKGLEETPERVFAAHGPVFAGYREAPVAVLATPFEGTAAYDERIAIPESGANGS